MEQSSQSPSSQMTFAGELWDNFEAVFKRLTIGRHDLKLMKAYMEELAAVQDSYGKALDKVSKLSNFKAESSLSACWTAIYSTGGSLSQQQIQYGQCCKKIAETLEVKIKEIKEVKTKLSAAHEKLCKQKASLEAAHNKAQQQYHEAVASADTALVAFQNGEGAKVAQKILSKLEKASALATKDLDKAQANYAKSVEDLAKFELHFIEKKSSWLDQFEKLERSRLTFLNDTTKQLVERNNFVGAAYAQIHERSTQMLEKVDIDNDVQAFIKMSKTDKQRPVGTVYRHQASPNIDKCHSQYFKLSCKCAGISAAEQAKPEPGPPTPRESSTIGSEKAYAVGMYDYTSPDNHPDDLKFSAGQVITLINYPANEDWWEGALGGRTGNFPAVYVRQLERSDPLWPAPRPSPSARPPPALPPSAPKSPKAPPPKTNSPAQAVSSPSPQSAAAPPAASSPKSPFASGRPPWLQQEKKNLSKDLQASVPSPGGSAASVDTEPGGPPSTAEGRGEGEAEDDSGMEVMHATCEALFPFTGQDDDEISFEKGDVLVITGKLDGWYLGKVQGSQKIGIFPSNYVNLG